jgi:anaerobic selenocysteine-containing dehydrogenase
VNGLNTLRGKDWVQLNPEDASKLGVEDGNMVRVISIHGEITAVARVTKHAAKGTAFMVFPFVCGPTSLMDSLAVDPIYALPRAAACAVRIENSR